MFTIAPNQFATAQTFQGALDGAFRKTGCVGKHTQACLDRLPAAPHCPTIKVEVNQKSGRLLIVTNQIAHQHVDDIVVNWNGLFKVQKVEPLRC